MSLFISSWPGLATESRSKECSKCTQCAPPQALVSKFWGYILGFSPSTINNKEILSNQVERSQMFWVSFFYFLLVRTGDVKSVDFCNSRLLGIVRVNRRVIDHKLWFTTECWLGSINIFHISSSYALWVCENEILSLTLLKISGKIKNHTWYLSFFYTSKIFGGKNLHQKKRVNYDKIHRKLPIFALLRHNTQ